MHRSWRVLVVIVSMVKAAYNVNGKNNMCDRALWKKNKTHCQIQVGNNKDWDQKKAAENVTSRNQRIKPYFENGFSLMEYLRESCVCFALFLIINVNYRMNTDTLLLNMYLNHTQWMKYNSTQISSLFMNLIFYRKIHSLL